MKPKEKHPQILFMATFPPRECGIATFTQDLTNSLNAEFSHIFKNKILAMNKNGVSIYNYPKEVLFQINDSNIQEYMDIAKKINEKEQIKLVCIQHEFGIFGGEFGNYLIPFLELISKPVVVTMHSILPEPDEKIKRVVQTIAKKVACVVVMTNKAVELLRNVYGISADIAVIPHGIHPVEFKTNIKEKAKLGYKDKTIILSFGLVGPGKGYEYVIDALSDVVKRFPNILYLIVGETHPVVRKNEGENYRNFLEDKVKKHKLQNHVKFYNKYMALGEILRYLQAADVYISSSQNPNQITSGTLVYGMGCGRAVISTPFLHAKDIVTEERGMLARFNDSSSFAEAITHIISNPKLKESMEKEAYAYTRQMSWPNVALAYKKIFDKYTKTGIETADKDVKVPSRIKLAHMLKLTDDFGIIQFVNHTKPDKSSGYTLDDNARAMLVACMYCEKFKDSSKLGPIKTYLAFIGHVQQPDGRLFNFVSHDKKVDTSKWSEDAHGRAMWALGYLLSSKSIPEEIRLKAENIFRKAANKINSIKSPRTVAFIILGLYFYNQANPSHNNISQIKRLADYLVSLYSAVSSEGWQWFEEYLTYSNARLPESLFYAYLAVKDERYLKIAKTSLDFLRSLTFENNVFAPIGHDGWYFRNGKKAHFDQQPVDASSTVQALILAHKVTKEKKYYTDALTAFQWFLGKNSLGQMVYDEVTGGCHDGIGSSSINMNEGAESTISYLIARLSLED